jgi:serine/threonine protein kinase
VRNEKARRFLASMRKKPGVDLAAYFPRADAGALALLRRLLAFDPTDRPTAEEALADPYFYNLHSPAREPSAQAISKLAFDFERHKLAIEEVRELIYREILEYHPQVLQDYLSGGRLPTFLYPSAVDNFKRQFHHLEGGGEEHCLLGHIPHAQVHAAVVFPDSSSILTIASWQPCMPQLCGSVRAQLFCRCLMFNTLCCCCCVCCVWCRCSRLCPAPPHGHQRAANRGSDLAAS